MLQNLDQKLRKKLLKVEVDKRSNAWKDITNEKEKKRGEPQSFSKVNYNFISIARTRLLKHERIYLRFFYYYLFSYFYFLFIYF